MRSLVEDVSKLCNCVEEADNVHLEVVNRGARRSIGFSMRVPNAIALAQVRKALYKDPRVQMVF